VVYVYSVTLASTVATVSCTAQVLLAQPVDDQFRLD